MRFDRSTVVACVVAIIIWNWATGTGGGGIAPGPGPSPRPLDGRPILKLISRAAKALLWVSLVAEPPPSSQLYSTTSVLVDEEGRPMLDHGRGW